MHPDHQPDDQPDDLDAVHAALTPTTPEAVLLAVYDAATAAGRDDIAESITALVE